jgi:hypothetical protein
MAPILTAEGVVRRIAAECAYVDERGGVGIWLEPAAAIVRAIPPGGPAQAKNAQTAAAAVKALPSSSRRHKGSYWAL